MGTNYELIENIKFDIKPLLDKEKNKITFSFVDFENLKQQVINACDNFDISNLTTKNLHFYEKEIATLKKTADFIKRIARDFVEEFALNLVGRTRGNCKVKGQVGELCEILMDKYNLLHAITVEMRNKGTPALETTETINNTTQVVLTLNKAFMSDLEVFCKERDIHITKKDK